MRMHDVQTGLFTMQMEEQRYGNKWKGKLENRLQGPRQLALEDHPRFYVGVQVTSLAGHPEETWTAKQDFQGSKWRNFCNRRNMWVVRCFTHCSYSPSVSTCGVKPSYLIVNDVNDVNVSVSMCKHA